MTKKVSLETFPKASTWPLQPIYIYAKKSWL
jgi:hypothetical protein